MKSYHSTVLFGVKSYTVRFHSILCFQKVLKTRFLFKCNLLLSGKHSVSYWSHPCSSFSRWGCCIQGCRQAKTQKGQDVWRGDHGQIKYGSMQTWIHFFFYILHYVLQFILVSRKTYHLSGLLCAGTIVSIGDPKKKYTRYEKIGQGWVLFLVLSANKLMFWLKCEWTHFLILQSFRDSVHSHWCCYWTRGNKNSSH